MELSDKKPSRFISVEISYYPLNEEYKIPIKDFIGRMKSYEILNVRTNTMSTQIFGEYDDVMLALTAEINKSFDLPHSVFVLKIINADLR
jgi:uncharacterized protein YqgV (UPF0045/DUF77 family)